LAVRAIHGIIRGLPASTDLLDAASGDFDVFDTDPGLATLTTRMLDAGALALLTAKGTWLLRPKPGAFDDDVPDSVRLDALLASPPEHALPFHHDPPATAAVVTPAA